MQDTHILRRLVKIAHSRVVLTYHHAAYHHADLRWEAEIEHVELSIDHSLSPCHAYAGGPEDALEALALRLAQARSVVIHGDATNRQYVWRDSKWQRPEECAPKVLMPALTAFLDRGYAAFDARDPKGRVHVHIPHVTLYGPGYERPAEADAQNLDVALRLLDEQLLRAERVEAPLAWAKLRWTGDEWIDLDFEVKKTPRLDRVKRSTSGKEPA